MQLILDIECYGNKADILMSIYLFITDSQPYLPDDLSDVGGDEVTDELFHVVVDGASLFHSGHNGGEVIISQDHLRGGLGHGGTGAHGDTDLGLLQGRGVVHTVTGHGCDLTVGLQVLYDLTLVGGLYTGE